MMTWIRVGDLLVADDATTAQYVNNSASLTRAALDQVYDKTVYASQAEALSGTSSARTMSPLRSKQAFDSWFATAYDGRINASIDSHQPVFARVFSVNVNNSRTGYADITFPTGMFTTVPVVQVSLYGQTSTLWYTYASTASVNGCRIGGTYALDQLVTTTIELSVTAMRPRY